MKIFDRIFNFYQNIWVSSPKDTVFPETIPEESSGTEDEHVVSVENYEIIVS